MSQARREWRGRTRRRWARQAKRVIGWALSRDRDILPSKPSWHLARRGEPRSQANLLHACLRVTSRYAASQTNRWQTRRGTEVSPQKGVVDAR